MVAKVARPIIYFCGVANKPARCCDDALTQARSIRDPDGHLIEVGQTTRAGISACC